MWIRYVSTAANVIAVRRFSLKTGDFLVETRTVSQQDLDSFSKLTGDFNPIHQQQARNSFVHGAFLNGMVAGLFGSKLPGAGTIVISQTFKFPSKCSINNPILIKIEILEVRKLIKARYECTQAEKVVFEGEAKLILNKDFILS